MELFQSCFPCVYLFLVINFLLISDCLSASLVQSSNLDSKKLLTDQKSDSGLPNCSRIDLTFTREDTIPKQSNGTSFLPDFDPTVVLNIYDAIANGDLWNDVVAGLRTIFAQLRNRLSFNPPSSPATKSFAENSTIFINQLPAVVLD